jgi:hypothetical protein
MGLRCPNMQCAGSGFNRPEKSSATDSIEPSGESVVATDARLAKRHSARIQARHIIGSNTVE